MKRRWWDARPAGKAAGVIFSCGVVASMMVSPVAADSLDRSFTAGGEASGGYVRYGIPQFLVVENFIDGGGPVSQSVVGSDGTAQAFASLPYPGPAAIGGPGTVATATGQSMPFGYPLYAGASYPFAPEQKVEDPSGTFRLLANAAADQTAALAQLRGQGGQGASSGSGGSSASTSVKMDSGTITVKADTLNEALNLGNGALQIASMRSESVTTYTKGQDRPSSTTELRIVGGKAGDVSFEFGPEGLKTSSQQGVPIPAGQGLDALNQALAPAGISLKFHQRQPIEAGAIAEALEITSVRDVPGAGKGTMQLRLGGALSYIALGPAEVSADTTGESGVGPAQSPAGTSPTTPQPESRPEPTAVSSSGAPDASAFPAASTGSDGSSAASAPVAEGTNGGSNSSASRPAGPEAVPPDSPAEIAAASSAPGAPAGTAAAAPLDTAQPRRAVLASAPHGLRAPSVLAGLLLAGGLAAAALVGFGRRARGGGQ